MRYVLLVTQPDGTELAFGPFSAGTIDQRAAETAIAFPDHHVRGIALLTFRALVEAVES